METNKRYQMSDVDIGKREKENMNQAFDSGWISSKGPFISQFEEEFAKFADSKYGISCSNGTTALHLAVRSLGIGKGDEVIVPNLTFASPANAVIYENAKPILVDVNRKYWCIDPKRIRENITKKTKAIIVVHLYGHPADMDQIMQIAKEYDLKVIEDCAEAHGATYKGKKVGSIGDIGCFSFYGNKIITTGEGGMITTSDQNLSDQIKILRDHGMLPTKKYWHEVVGYNYRMTNIQAAIGLAQLETIEEKIAKRKWIAKKYFEYIDNSATLQPQMSWGSNVYWLPTLTLDASYNSNLRDTIMLFMLKKGVETRPVFYPLNEMAPYLNSRLYPNSKHISDYGLSLPVSNKFQEEDIQYIARVFNESLFEAGKK